MTLSANLDKFETRKAEIQEKNAEMTAVDKLSSAVVYKDVLPDTDVEYIVTPTGLKENLIIHTPPKNMVEEVDEEVDAEETISSSENDVDELETETDEEAEEASPPPKRYVYYTFDMDFGDLVPAPQENGSILLSTKGRNGSDIFIIEAPYLYDSLGIHCGAEQTLEKVDGKWVLTVEVDANWLLDEARVYPVVLDPTIIVVPYTHSSVHDAEVSTFMDLVNTNYGSSTIMDIGKRNYPLPGVFGTYKSRAYIRFTAPVLPQNAIVINCYMTLQTTSLGSNNLRVNAYPVSTPWNESSITWANQPFPHEDNSYKINNILIDSHHLSESNTSYDFDITPLALEWYAGTRANWGLVFGSDNEHLVGSVGIRTRENPISKPICTVEYMRSHGMEDWFTFESFDVGRAGTVYLNDFYRELNIVRSELSLGDINIYRVYYPNWASEGISGAIQNASFPYGANWKLNYNQSVNKIGDKYVYIGDKGQRIEFENSGEVVGTRQLWDVSDRTLTDDYYTLWVPQTGATLANIVLESDDGFLTFHPNGYLHKIKETEDAAQSITINYVSNTPRISEIIDTSGRKFAFTYNTDNKLNSIAARNAGNNAIRLDGVLPLTISYTYGSNDSLRFVNYPDSETVGYNFTNNQVTVTDVDGYNIRITHSNNIVTKVQEFTGNTAGNHLDFVKNNDFQLTVTDNLGNRNIKQFDEYGQTICVIDGDGNYIAETFENKDETGKKQRGVLLTESGSDTTSINLLRNHSAEFSGIWHQSAWGGPSINGINLSDSAQAYAGSKSLSILETLCGSTIPIRPVSVKSIVMLFKRMSIQKSQVGALPRLTQTGAGSKSWRFAVSTLFSEVPVNLIGMLTMLLSRNPKKRTLTAKTSHSRWR